MLYQFTTGSSDLLIGGTSAGTSVSPIVAVVIGFWIVIGLIVLAFFAMRLFLRIQGKDHIIDDMELFLVTIPKFRSDEDTGDKKGKAQKDEAVAVAESFFASIGGMRVQKGFKSWLFGRQDHFSFEIVADEGLVKFYMASPKRSSAGLQQQLLSQFPDAHIDYVEDYNIFSPSGQILSARMRFKRPDGFPIRTYEDIDSDPMNVVTSTLSKLDESEGAVVQFIVRSAKASWRNKGLEIARAIQSGIKMSDAVSGKRKNKKSLLSDFKSDEAFQKEKSRESEYRITPQEEEVVKRIESKASKSGMDVNIRIVVSAGTAPRTEQVLRDLISSFSQYNIYEYGNSLEPVIPSSKSRLIRRFIFRAFEVKQKMVMNTEELASLWHPPLPWTETPNILWMKARRAPAPVNTPKKGLLLGNNLYRGVKTPVYIDGPDRQRHMYVIGRSGAGKSNFITSLAVQDIHAGHGVCVLDPHGDLVEDILGSIPKERIDDVIIFDPSDLERPVGLNILEAHEEHQKDNVVQEMISIFYKLFPPEMIGPMFEHQMRNVMLTLMADLESPGTIAEIPRMFSDDAFAKTWVDKLKDPVVRSFWEEEMAKTSDYHKSEMLGYLVSKVGRFVENTMMRNIIGQTKSGFNFREVMDKKKILLVNLSKGKTGEVNASLLGLIIVAKLQMAALARADMKGEDREDFFLYIDEFQNFITDSIATILSEARKYKLDLILAHQYMGQLVKDGKTEVRDAVLGNVGTMFVSRIGVDDTEVLAKEFEPTFSGFDLINAEKYTWYTKMIIDNDAQKPFTLHSVPAPKGNPELADAIKELSRLKYGRDRSIVEAEILERTQLGKSKAAIPPAVGEL